jgi:hypothetical protein
MPLMNARLIPDKAGRIIIPKFCSLIADMTGV